MIRHSARVRFLASSLAVGGALVLALALSSVMEDQRCRDTGGRFDGDAGVCMR